MERERVITVLAGTIGGAALALCGNLVLGGQHWEWMAPIAFASSFVGSVVTEQVMHRWLA